MEQLYRNWWPVLLLGLATIGAYGVAYYSIGVLIPAIAADTGWRTGALTSAFSLGLLAQGAAAVLLGRVFDRFGSFPVFAASLSIGALFLFAASFAPQTSLFVLAWMLGAAVIGGGLYYNVTMPAIGRLFPHRRAAALSGLTLLGALASPIFYPLAAWLIEALGWRAALRALVLLLFCLTAPALLVRAPGSSRSSATSNEANFAELLREPAVYRAMAVFAITAFANSAVMLHQVSIMEATGLSLAAASGYAGLRGAGQLPGRILLAPLTRLLKLRSLMAACYALAATGVIALLLALNTDLRQGPILYFALASGVSLGLLSPLNGLFQAEVYGESRLGTLSGLTVVIVSTAGAAGSWLGGLSVDITGSFEALLLGSAALQSAAILALVWQGRARSAPHPRPVGPRAPAREASPSSTP